MAAPHLAAPPHMEGGPQQTSQTWRMTRGGRKIWYRLTVLQEPERARACGSGPKSTTDRRPVDPPPVIELRIFEGDSIESGKDITFTYNANFFLFTTLEHARPVANGRVNTPAATTPPVLTGMFVSGMAYLDRPTEAGYFLFPDLSVRHEGRYKLIFNLYEQTKEDKDKDPEASRAPPMPAQSPSDFNDLDESFDHRLKVESRAFSVYSAKKFPGLTESTVLSRTISEQGCRVRIRRDVRMRRRENKPSSSSDYEAKQKEEYDRRQRTQTPELKPNIYRARSLSNSSMEGAAYPGPYHRRPSMDYQAAPPPPPAYGPPPQTPTNAGGHLQFGQSASTHYAPPPPPPPPPQQYPPQRAQASPMTSKQPVYPPPPVHQRAAYQASQPAEERAPTPSPCLPPLQIGPEYQCQGPPRDSNDHSRRPSASYTAPIKSQTGSHYAPHPSEAPIPAPYSGSEPRQSSRYPPPASASQSPVSPNYPALPSAESQASSSYPVTPSADSYPASHESQRPQGSEGEKKHNIKLAPLLNPDEPPPSHITLPPLTSLSPPKSNGSTMSDLPSTARMPELNSSCGVKRQFHETFNTEGQYQSLSNGARQTDPHHNPPKNRLAGWDEAASSGPRFYPRADGHFEIAPESSSNADNTAAAPRHPNAPYNL